MLRAILQTPPEPQQQLGQPGRPAEVGPEPVDDTGLVLPEGAEVLGTPPRPTECALDSTHTWFHARTVA